MAQPLHGIDYSTFYMVLLKREESRDGFRNVVF